MASEKAPTSPPYDPVTSLDRTPRDASIRAAAEAKDITLEIAGELATHFDFSSARAVTVTLGAATRYTTTVTVPSSFDSG